jgi:predicted KAP-like P-loop ATPase
MIKFIRNELVLDKSKPQATLSDGSSFVFVEFNAWLYQGYDDARAALLETVATVLKREANARQTGFDKVMEFAKRVNWFRAVKVVGTSAAALMAAHILHPGLSLFALAGGLLGIKKEEGSETKEKVEPGGKAQTHEDPWLKAAEEDTPPKEIQALRSALEDVLKELNITLVVLIDDLDRCLPETAVSTLEAIRLLLFMDHTAFVIAADEAMIKHAVKRHFQGVDDELVINYFDKLIQVPIRVPQLGAQEVRAYMMLLYIEEGLLDGAQKEILRQKICERLGQTWRGLRVDAEYVKSLGIAMPHSLQARLDSVDRLATLMTSAKGIAGNPRLIKRFLNALSMRMSLAKAQGVSVDEAVLTKLLLFERCGSPDAYAALLKSVTDNDDGKPMVIGPMESKVRISEKEEFLKPWDGPFMRDWFALEPALAETDIRGALYVSREHAPLVLPDDRLSAAATQILAAMLEHPEMSSGLRDKLKNLDSRSISTILDKLLDVARKEQEWGAPKILTACLVITQADVSLGARLATFLKERPAVQIKASIVPKIGDEPWAADVFSQWAMDPDVIQPVKNAIKSHKEKK